MKLLKLTASFGKLQNAVLEPGEGFTLLEGPNEGGKSTWSAFLRAMFYGFPPRDRDRQGYLAEKTRYQPWSGAAMEGSVDLLWQDKKITLRRGPKGAAPFGAFSAVYTDTQELVPFLTAENCGETLLGVSREVFERTAFVGQGSIPLTRSPDLEARIAALATAGEEDVSYSQVDRRLKDWRNRRRSNSATGLVPKLERELAQVNAALERQSESLRRSGEAQVELEALEGEKARVDADLLALEAQSRAGAAQRHAQAQADLERAEQALAQAVSAAALLPPADVLREAQEDLSYVNSIGVSLKTAQRELEPAQLRAFQAEKAAQDPIFDGMDPTEAIHKTQTDCETVRRLQKGGPPLFLFLGALVGVGLGTALYQVFHGSPYAALLLAAGVLVGVGLGAIPFLLVGKSRKKRAGAILSVYEAQTADDLLKRSAAYNANLSKAETARQAAGEAEQAVARLAGQQAELRARLLELVHPFAPEVTDLFGVSAALSRALQHGEALRAAQIRRDGAKALADSLPKPEGTVLAPVHVPEGDPAALKRRQAELSAQVRQVEGEHARLTGELRSLGDPAQLQERRERLTDELSARNGELIALDAALEALRAADDALRERFSPAVNERAGAWLSALTGGKYDQAVLTRDFLAQAGEAGGAVPHSALSLSAGTLDQLYLAVRLAVCELVLPPDVPLILDDALDAFDDGRMALALDALRSLSDRRQILFFTCHRREGKALAGERGVTVLEL